MTGVLVTAAFHLLMRKICSGKPARLKAMPLSEACPPLNARRASKLGLPKAKSISVAVTGGWYDMVML